MDLFVRVHSVQVHVNLQQERGQTLLRANDNSCLIIDELQSVYKLLRLLQAYHCKPSFIKLLVASRKVQETSATAQRTSSASVASVASVASAARVARVQSGKWQMACG